MYWLLLHNYDDFCIWILNYFFEKLRRNGRRFNRLSLLFSCSILLLISANKMGFQTLCMPTTPPVINPYPTHAPLAKATHWATKLHCRDNSENCPYPSMDTCKCGLLGTSSSFFLPSEENVIELLNHPIGNVEGWNVFVNVYGSIRNDRASDVQDQLLYTFF